jgi:hypothetical protein
MTGAESKCTFLVQRTRLPVEKTPLTPLRSNVSFPVFYYLVSVATAE